MKNENRLQQEDRFKTILHDFRAPLINSVGFTRELRTSVSRVRDLLEKHDSELPASFQKELLSLLANDLEPCVLFLEDSIDKLEKCADGVLSVVSSVDEG